MKNPTAWRATLRRSPGIGSAEPNDERQAGCLSYFDAIDEMKAAKATKSNDPRFLILRAVLTEREAHPEKTMAQLYDPDTTKRSEKEWHNVTGRSPTSRRGVHMPAGLRAAHHNLDQAVDRLCRQKPFTSDEERLEHLFKLYEEMTAKEELV